MTEDKTSEGASLTQDSHRAEGPMSAHTPMASPLGSIRFLTIASAFGLVALFFYILIVGRDFLVPFVVAIAIWYVMIALKESFKQSQKYIKAPVPDVIAMILAIATTVIAVTLIVVLINSSVNEVIATMQKYQDRINVIIGDALEIVGYEGENPLKEFIANLDARRYFSPIAAAVGGLAQDMGLIIVYVLFLLLETWTFGRKLNALATTDSHRETLRSTIREIGEDINTYMRIKTGLSALVAVLCYVAMKLAGVDFAEFWAVLFFLFNYIPTIGAIIGVFFPAMFMIVQFSSVPLIISVIAVLIAIPTIINNFVEPRMMGRSLNLSSLVIIMSLILWGSIWGIIGMFLCVPIMVILNIILAKFEPTRPVAVLLSANGEIDSNRVVAAARARQEGVARSSVAPDGRAS
ncbi:MAG: AI-2E family transporter [Rhodospirillaceae bacterium]|nr:AI-2E family transporter [Rhodospirillaceae bacterium]